MNRSWIPPINTPSNRTTDNGRGPGFYRVSVKFPSMREIQIELNDADQRIDRYLRKYLPGASLGYIYKLARTGKVKLNGKRVDNETRIQKDDVLKIFLHDEEIA